jgi:outer membrane receptor protein involved in Fe transport
MQKKLPLIPALIFVYFFYFIPSSYARTSHDSLRFQEVFISLDLNNIPLGTALQQIGSKSGFGILYNEQDLPKGMVVNFHSSKVSLEEALDYLLKDTNLGYKAYKMNIVIFVKQEKKKAKGGIIEGNLTDATSGEALIGANVMIVGTTMGSNTDASGHYAIQNVPYGVYQLAISYIGYETVLVRDVKVTGEQTITVNHSLKPSETQLQAIEIIGNKTLSGNVIESNEISMTNDIRTSALIITGISAQQIARSVDQDAGEVARRLPGVSVLNNFVNIRGMHERYNLTILNGMIAPSSETDRRAFSYDLLPSNMIDKMTVYRSPGPELLADWAGGVIKVETKNTSIARQIEVNLSGWYRDQTTFKDYNTYQGGGKDWMGKDDGTRALPKGFPDVLKIPGYVAETGRSRKLSAISPDDLAQNAQWGQKLYSRWNLKRDKAPLDYRAGINYYDSWPIGKMRLNNLTSVNTTQATQIINQQFYPARYVDEQGKLVNNRAYEDTISRKTARWGFLENLRLSINPSHIIEVKGIFNQLGMDETYVRKGYNNIFSDFDLGYVTKVFYTYRSRYIASGQLAGMHTLGSQKDHQLNWSAGYSESKDDLPGQRLMNLQAINTADENAPRYLTNGGELGVFSIANSLYYSSSKEKNFTGFLDYEKKFSNGISVKLGAFDEKKDRNINGRLIVFGTDQSGNFLQNAEGAYVNEYNAEDALGPASFKPMGGGLFLYDNPYLSGQYKVDGNIVAGYGAVKIPFLGERVTVYGGVRYEKQDLKIITPYRDRVGDSTIVNRSTPYWLPSVNVTYAIQPKLLLRAAYGKTINRPNYREMTPITVNDPRLEVTQTGNSKLVDARIDNADVRLEWYPSESEFISVGVFYKRLQNAIEPYYFSTGKLEQILFTNTPKASVKGFEAEIRKNLSFIPVRWSQYFSTIANFAVLKSDVKFQDSLFNSTPGNFQDFRTKSRPLEGTASYVINAGLYFEHPEWGTKISLLYNVLGQRLIYAGTPFFPETYELPRHVLDLTFRQKMTKHLELRAGVQDLLNQPRRLYRDYNRDQRYNPDLWNKLPFKDYMFQKYKPGSYYMLGINLTF